MPGEGDVAAHVEGVALVVVERAEFAASAETSDESAGDDAAPSAIWLE